MAGFYRSKYKGENGEDKYMACTQFEATDARRAFPCWDEPAKKATFSITIRTPAGLRTLSNMPVQSETANDDGTSDVKFDTVSCRGRSASCRFKCAPCSHIPLC